MKLYLAIIACCVFFVALAISFIARVGFWSVLGYTAFATVLVILVDAVVATVSRLLPEKCANHEYRIFAVSAKEKKIYEKLKIRLWKDKIPEIGHLTGFRKNQLDDPKSVEYVERFLLESCYGEIDHFLSILVGFVILLFYPLTPLWLPISICVAIINAILNVPSLLVLRYNSYKLEILRNSILRKQQRGQKAEDAVVNETAPIAETEIAAETAK